MMSDLIERTAAKAAPPLPIVTADNAKAELEKRAWELIDLLAVFFGDSIDARTWDHLLVYAPKKPPPDEIAGLIERLRGRAEQRADEDWSREATIEWQAAAAIERLARENRQLESEWDAFDQRIRELEAERDASEARVHCAMELADARLKAIDAIRAKTIEECLAEVIAAPDREEAIEAIRALNQPSEDKA
jgi:hypothetical protein